MSLGLSGDNMSKYLKAIIPNISQEEIDNLTGATDVAAEEVVQNNVNDIMTAYTSLLESGSDPAAAKNLLIAQGYNAEEVEQAVGAVDAYTQANTEAMQAQNYDALNTYTSNAELGNALSIEGDDPPIEDITATVDNLVKSGNLTKEQGEEIKKNAIQREVDSVMNNILDNIEYKDSVMKLFLLADEYGGENIVDKIDGINYNPMGVINFMINGKPVSLSFVPEVVKNPPKEVSESGKDIVEHNGKVYIKQKGGANVIWKEVKDIGGGQYKYGRSFNVSKGNYIKDGVVTSISEKAIYDVIKAYINRK